MRNLLESLNTLTRLNQLELDQLRVELSELLNEQQHLTDRSYALEKQENQERQWGSKYIDKAQTLPAFTQKLAASQQEINAQLIALQAEVAQTMNELQGRFQERKRYEIVDKKQRLLNAQTENKLEQNTYDEAAQRRKVTLSD